MARLTTKITGTCPRKETMNNTLEPVAGRCSVHRLVRLLDLFCGAGGAGEGYRLAGFSVLGVDNRPQPKNPHRFVLADALEYLETHGHEYDAIHASPPCQAYTKAGKQWRKEGREYPNMISATREALERTGKPWVIENVPGAPLRNPVMLNGSTFGIRVHRPRYFETSFDLAQPEVPPMTPVKMGRPIREGDIVQPVGHFSGVRYAAKEMGLPWMGQAELAQAIPPAYTKYVGQTLMRVCLANGKRNLPPINNKQTIKENRMSENKQNIEKTAEQDGQVDAIVSPQFRCKCGKMMKYWDGCAMGAYGVDYENCEDPQYKCECGNKVYLDFDK